ncbi:sorbitol/mannitol transport system substrate-binding protein [Nakamurella flavida]|nr:sugar ABC transporter substrate-binding protein [Nakamurella flavida]MDP9777866.1 sorbitol/mannitol transport system substrate-binding protein [Nakamurella flavida]
MRVSPFRSPTRLMAGATAALLVLGTAACGGAGGGSSSGGGSGTAAAGAPVRILMVNNPQMVDLQNLAPEFTKETGIQVQFTVLPENDLRDKVSQEFTNQSGQYDVATLSNFEIPFYSKNGWLTSLQDYSDKDTEFNQADIFPSMTASLKGPDGLLYGEPFYGESSFLMYRKDVMEAKGLTVPNNPTWDEVADLAAKADGAQSGMKGICLRGLPGWGQLFAPLTTVVNTFGGTWFEKDWTAKVNSQEFIDATNFYVNLVKEHGEVGAPQAGFTECLNAMTQSQVAMWYDATSAAGSLEADDSPVKGKVGYAQAPVKETKSSGWLYAWSWAIEKSPPTPTTPGSSSPGPPPRSTRSSWAPSSAGRRSRPASARRCTRTRTTRRLPVRSPTPPWRPSRTPIRPTRASSPGRPSASSSSTSRSSPIWERVSRRMSRQPSPARRPSRKP